MMTVVFSRYLQLEQASLAIQHFGSLSIAVIHVYSSICRVGSLLNRLHTSPLTSVMLFSC